LQNLVIQYEVASELSSQFTGAESGEGLREIFRFFQRFVLFLRQFPNPSQSPFI
jgi:hypothetical protein